MVVFASFIPGIVFGLEIFTGEDLLPDDKFAATLSLGIIRITLVITK